MFQKFAYMQLCETWILAITSLTSTVKKSFNVIVGQMIVDSEWQTIANRRLIHRLTYHHSYHHCYRLLL